MSTVEYLQGRKKYRRPQAVLFANNQGTVVTVTEIEATESIPMGDYYIPLGVEINQNSIDQNGYEFLITSDDSRGPLDFTEVRLEKRERTINGRMRSYHIADKLQISMSWDMLPSRGFATAPLFDNNGVPRLNEETPLPLSQKYTSDGGAGGVELLDWYQNYQDSFWVYLSYDKYSNYGKSVPAYQNLNKYSQVVEVFFSDFSYSVEKRGGTNYDFWNVSLTLEEV